MRIERSFNVPREVAVQRLNDFVAHLENKQFGDGIAITDLKRSWDGDVMHISFRAKKGFMGATISGSAHIEEKSAILELQLPGLLKALVSEDKIEAAIHKEFDRVFAA